MLTINKPLDWNEKLISECEKTLSKWYSAYSDVRKSTILPDELLDPLYDDLNTPGYIANLHSLYRVNLQMERIKDKAKNL